MEIEHNLTIEWSRDYLKARKNITLVIKYLEELRDNKPNVTVNNDAVRLLMEALTTANVMYQDLNKLPINNMELMAQNHVLKVENERLRNEIEKI